MQSLPSVRRLVPPSLAPRPPANLLGGVDLVVEDEVTVKVGSAAPLAGARTLTVAPDRRAPIVEGSDDEPTAIFRPRTLPKAPSTLVVFDDDEPTTLWKSAPASAAPVSGAPVSAVESVKPAAERTMRAADVRSALADALRALS